jgi:hypothetical protein
MGNTSLNLFRDGRSEVKSVQIWIAAAHLCVRQFVALTITNKSNHLLQQPLVTVFGTG